MTAASRRLRDALALGAVALAVAVGIAAVGFAGAPLETAVRLPDVHARSGPLLVPGTVVRLACGSSLELVTGRTGPPPTVPAAVAVAADEDRYRSDARAAMRRECRGPAARRVAVAAALLAAAAVGAWLALARLDSTATDRPTARRVSRRDLAFPVAAYGVWRVVFAAVLAALGGASGVQVSGFPAASHPTFFTWDGAWYQQIARHGYAIVGDGTGQQPTGFFPLLPWATRALQVVVRSEIVAAQIVVTAAGLAAVTLVYLVIREWRGTRVARVAVVLLLVFPASLFLTVFYTEGPVIALTAGALFAQQRRRLPVAGMLAFAATMTRYPGALVVPALLVGELQRERRVTRDMAWVLVGVAGVVPVIVAQAFQTHDGLALASSQQAWGREPMAPWTAIEHSVRALAGGATYDGWSASALESHGSPRDLVYALLFVGLGVAAAVLRWPWAAVTLLAGMVLFPLASGVQSMTRYVYAAWPAFGVLADVLDRLPRWLSVLIVALLAATTVAVVHDWADGLFVA